MLGIVKLIIAYSIWQHSRRARLLSIILVLTLGLGGILEIYKSFSWFKALATGIDFLLLYYLVFVLPKHILLDKIKLDAAE